MEKPDEPISTNENARIIHFVEVHSVSKIVFGPRASSASLSMAGLSRPGLSAIALNSSTGSLA